MSASGFGRRLGNALYRSAFPIYRPLYSAFKARSDRAERRLLKQFLHEGSVAVDAGANIGIYSVFLSECVGPSGMVYSFEPSPENFAHLTKAVCHLANVQAQQAAISATTGEQLLYVSNDLNVDHRLYPTNDARQTVSIRAIALDDFFPPGTRVDLLKLDIQGYELHALRGAARVLSDNPRLNLLLEFWPHGLRASGSSPEELHDFMVKRGFRIMSPAGREFEDIQKLSSDEDPFIYMNLFATRDHTGTVRTEKTLPNHL